MTTTRVAFASEACKRGHLRIPENTYIRPDGFPQCILCQKDRQRRFIERGKFRTDRVWTHGLCVWCERPFKRKRPWAKYCTTCRETSTYHERKDEFEKRGYLVARYKAVITTKDLRFLMFQQNRQCAICETKLGKKWHLDHIVSRKQGGSTAIENLQILCAMCNVGKYTYTQEEYIAHCIAVAKKHYSSKQKASLPLESQLTLGF